VAARLGDFLALHRRSRVGKAKFMDERMERFFRGALPALAEHDGVALWFSRRRGPHRLLRVSRVGRHGRPVQSGFAPEAASLSPGLVLLSH